MTTTTGDASTLKTPSTLSSGDLVSRLLAATPPYLYNVPLTPHSFFFSEMLRSFVQTKTEASTSASSNQPSVARRRKRSWRDARDRPLELTTKDKTHNHHHHQNNNNNNNSNSNSNGNNNNSSNNGPHHHHHHHHHQLHPHASHLSHPHQQGLQLKEKYYPMQQQTLVQQQNQPETQVEHRFKTQSSLNESSSYRNENVSKRLSNYDQKGNSYSSNDSVGGTEAESRTDFGKHNRDFYDDSSRRFSTEQSAQQESIFGVNARKIKPEETSPSQLKKQPETTGDTKNNEYTPEASRLEETTKMTHQELSFLADQKSKLQDFTGHNYLPTGLTGLPRIDEQAKNFGINGVNLQANNDFLTSGPLWYPPYPTMSQSYPGIDPLHFFIDLRVSGHIWDRKMNERQLNFKSKHCSAFRVPQAKEYNRPLDLTRDEATASSSSSTSRNNSANNQRGTHFIMKNLTDTYRDIREMEKNFNNRAESTTSSKSSSSDETSGKDGRGPSLSKGDASACSSTSRDQRQQKDEENDGKDLRALIGLELVVDYVKEPKEDPNIDEEQSPDVGE